MLRAIHYLMYSSAPQYPLTPRTLSLLFFERTRRVPNTKMSYKQCTARQAVPNPAEPDFEIISSSIPAEVSSDDVLLKVLACGVCHADSFAVMGIMGCTFPAIPGHEVIGKVVKAGEGTEAQMFAEGTIVGVGWHGEHCRSCEACTDGDFVCCEKQKIVGIHIHGGYQEYMVASARALARVPDGMDPVVAAPLMCAGVAVFNSLRNNVEKCAPPALVAVVGIGGLGHLAIQYAAKCGYKVVAISRGISKKEHCFELGATHYIDSEAGDSSAALQALGGAKVILCTATNAKVMGDCIDGLSRNGKLVILGAPRDTIPVAPTQLIGKRRSVVGFPSGAPRDSQDSMEFAHLHGITPKTTVFDGVEKAPDAYAAMMRGEYRAVIKIARE